MKRCGGARPVAHVRDEGTQRRTYFVYVTDEIGQTSMAARFSWKRSAERVAAAINAAYAKEQVPVGAARKVRFAKRGGAAECSSAS